MNPRKKSGDITRHPLIIISKPLPKKSSPTRTNIHTRISAISQPIALLATPLWIASAPPALILDLTPFLSQKQNYIPVPLKSVVWFDMGEAAENRKKNRLERTIAIFPRSKRSWIRQNSPSLVKKKRKEKKRKSVENKETNTSRSGTV